MRSENMQFNLLCEQSVGNVWRKVAYQQLLDSNEPNYQVLPGQPTVDEAIDVFRGRIDYAIENTVPTPMPHAMKIKKLVNDNKKFVTSNDSKQVVQHIQGLVDSSEKQSGGGSVSTKRKGVFEEIENCLHELMEGPR